MAWIQTIAPEEAEGGLVELYAAAADPTTGELDAIMRIHSLHPAGLSAHLELYKAVMTGSSGLRKVDREMIALVVSRLNSCHY
ncbi:MAG: alkylhydroperoxidase family enzyme [Planctomycetota bacterium]|jgi:alkylhydroperoxidase family enzyme